MSGYQWAIKSLPSTFQKLGRFTLIGKTYITDNFIKADVSLDTDLGSTISNLELTNIVNFDLKVLLDFYQ